MPRGDNRPTADAPTLGLFKLPEPFVEAAVQSCRLFNTALDALFYDVPALEAGLAQADRRAGIAGVARPSRILSFDALRDPEGSLLLVDPSQPPRA